MGTLRWLGPLLLCMGCATGGAVFDSSWQAVKMDPPPRYQEHWRAMEVCSGLRGSFAEVRWYIAFGDLRIDGEWTGAVSWMNHRQIVIRAALIDVDYMVRHEILHILVNEPGHPSPPFVLCAPLSVL